jgi:SAM-dependent methyltransferase
LISADYVAARTNHTRRRGASLWLRIEGEAAGCPACGSSRIVLLDILSLPREVTPHKVGFVTGCRQCGVLFSNPLPTPEHLATFYGPVGSWAESYRDRREQFEKRAAERVKRDKPPITATTRKRPRDHLIEAMSAYFPVQSPASGSKALDFGCGDGKFLDSLQKRGWTTYGIEPSGDIAFLRHQRLPDVPADASFDLIVAHHVLEHVLRPLDVLQQFAHASREGGFLFVSVPRLDTLPVHGDLRYCINGRTHLACFSETCLRGLLARAGFETIARLDEPNLDQMITGGVPLRLRLLARRTSGRVPLPRAPLRAAVRALSGHAQARSSRADRLRAMLPVRVRAAMQGRRR